jgi:indolepyruvate decarboxylase
MPNKKANLSVGEYLIDALANRGVNHVFGVPGDFILGLHVIGDERGMRMVNCTREEAATYAADGYAREKGLGAVAVTYGVGILATMAAVGSANAERVPLVVIGGAPGMAERDGRRIHHMPSADMNSPYRMMAEIAPYHVLLDDPDEAYDQIDWLLLHVQEDLMPGYIELPRDLISTVPGHPRPVTRPAETLVPMARLSAAVDDVIARINNAKRPIMWVGHGARALQYGDRVLAFAEATGIPMVESVMGKGAVDETHPLVMGVYVGAGSTPELREYVESVDLVIQVGVNINDITTGAFTTDVAPENRIHFSADGTSVEHRFYEGVDLAGIAHVLERRIDEIKPNKVPKKLPHAWASEVTEGDRITTDVVADRLQRFVEKSDIVLCDVGVGAHLSMDARLNRSGQFHIARLYVGMGFAVPASYGAALARGKGRPIVLVGDGSFQMTGFDLSTAVREGIAPIVLVLDNHGYGAERSIHDGDFNDIAQWDYAAVGAVVGAIGLQAYTPEQLDQALARARADRDTAYIIQVDLDKLDVPRGLKALGEGLADLMG